MRSPLILPSRTVSLDNSNSDSSSRVRIPTSKGLLPSSAHWVVKSSNPSSSLITSRKKRNTQSKSSVWTSLDNNATSRLKCLETNSKLLLQKANRVMNYKFPSNTSHSRLETPAECLSSLPLKALSTLACCTVNRLLLSHKDQ
jgi:hypothetical protein